MTANQRAIVPITTWVNGQTKTISVLQLDSYSAYNFLDTAGFVMYTLCSEETIDSNVYAIPLINNTLPLNWSLVENWGADDQPIFDYVAQQLNLTLV